MVKTTESHCKRLKMSVVAGEKGAAVSLCCKCVSRSWLFVMSTIVLFEYSVLKRPKPHVPRSVGPPGSPEHRRQFGREVFWEPGQKEEVRLLLVPLSAIQLQLLFPLPVSNGSHPWAAWPGVVHTALLRL